MKELTVCCMCHRIQVGEHWLAGPVADKCAEGKPLIHGYCPLCYEKTMAELDAEDRRKTK
jgi:hypothetical protein